MRAIDEKGRWPVLLKHGLGEIKFGTRTGKVPPLIDKATWDEVQKKVERPGPQGQVRSLAGTAQCARVREVRVTNVDRPAAPGGRDYPFYRGTNPDCRQRMSIGAVIVEDEVVAKAKVYLAEIKETASEEFKVEELRGQVMRSRPLWMPPGCASCSCRQVQITVKGWP
jgi:hypothetical protein